MDRWMGGWKNGCVDGWEREGYDFDGLSLRKFLLNVVLTEGMN